MTSESAKHIFINEHCVKKFDIPLPEFKFFKGFLEEHITEDMIEHDKIDQIRGLIDTFLPAQYRKIWIILLGKDLAYNLQYKKKNLLILKIKEVTFFIYQGKYIDMPILEPLETFPDTLNEEKINMYKSRITKIGSNGDSEGKFVPHFINWTAKFFAKNEGKFKENYNDFENLFLKKIKSELQLFAGKGFWNIFIGQKVTYFMEAHRDEVDFSYTIDLVGLPGNRGKKTVAVFQKKGEPDPYFQYLK